MRKLMISTLPSASVSSPQVMPFVGQAASDTPTFMRSAARPWAVATTLRGLDAGGAAWKPIAPAGASALTHPCAEQQKHAVSGEHFALSATAAGSYGTGITFGNQTQLSVDVKRVDGPAGSPPRGTPV